MTQWSVCNFNIFGVGGPYIYIIIHILLSFVCVVGSSFWLFGVDVDGELC